MKSLGIAVLAMSMLSGCAGALIDQTPIKMADGSGVYIIKDTVSSKENNSELKNRASEICKSGYDLLHEEVRQLQNLAGMKLPWAWEVSWQIKCKTSEQLAS
jgi:hypothetical protein